MTTTAPRVRDMDAPAILAASKAFHDIIAAFRVAVATNDQQAQALLRKQHARLAAEFDAIVLDEWKRRQMEQQ